MRPNRRVHLILVVFTVLSTLYAQQKTADEPIKVDTALVSVPIIVSDRQGHYISGLNVSDFSLSQDGAPQKIDFFAATEEPLNVALLIDTSQSTRDVLDDIKDSASKFVGLLNPIDKAMIVSFDYSTHVLSPLTSDTKQLKGAIKNAEVPEYLGTSLRDAIDITIKNQFRGVIGRKAIILLTDGKDAGSRISSLDLLYSVQETDVMVYTIFYSTEESFRQVRRGLGNRRGVVFGGRFPRNDRFPRFPDRRVGIIPNGRNGTQRRQKADRQNENAKEFLVKIADATAGRSYESKSSKLKETFGLIVEELRHQYRLGFYPPEGKDDTVVHSLKVKVSRTDAVVRSRINYRTKPDVEH